jgi:hypothetical protein
VPDPKRIIHFADASSRHAKALCDQAAPGDQVWVLSKARPPRAYVGRTRFTVLIRAMRGSALKQDGVELHPCTPCMQKVQAISERLNKERV